MTAQTRPDELIRILRAEFVTKAGGVPGSLCVTFTCGATGWRGAGGTIVRTLVHEVAFQLSAADNARGVYAVDLQQETNAVTQVAAAGYSAILSGRRNEIGAGATWATICGSYNEILDTSSASHIMGEFNDVYDASYGVLIVGTSIDVEKGTYCFFSGEGHRAVKGAKNFNSAFGVWCLGEDNTFTENANDNPSYSGMMGINLEMDGDVVLCHQLGEENGFYSLGGAGVTTQLWSLQSGYTHYAQHVMTNTQFGRSTKSSLPSATSDFYHGRILNQGDVPNDFPTDGTGYPGGFNQDSWFAQSDVITTWNIAWTTARFQFPIIQDSVWGFTAFIAATERGCANSHFWKIEGMIENDGGVTTMLVAATTNIYRDVATKEWQAVADNANDRLAFQFRDTAGPDATWTNIQLRLQTIEVGAEV